MRTQGWSKRGRRRALAAWGASALGALALTACGGDDGNSAPKPDNTIVWAVGADAVGLDPQNAGQEASQRILALIYQQLLTRADGIDLAPQLASDFREVSPSRYEVTLRAGVKFSNGREMTTDDVVGSFTRLESPDLGSYLMSRLTNLKSVTAVDDSTVRFELKEPQSNFLDLLADPAAAIMPMKEIDSGEIDPAREVLGTGPYKVDDHQKDNSWKLSANPYYWEQGLPKVENLTIQVLADEGTILAALRSGSADVASLSNADSATLVEGINDASQVTQQNPNYYVLVLNSVSEPSLASVEVRQGVNLAIDRERVSEVALGGTSEPVGPLPECPPDSLEFSNPDTERAEELLDTAAEPGPLDLAYDSAGGQELASIAQAIQSQLETVGVTVNLQPLPSAQFVDALVGGKTQMALTFYTAGTYPYIGLINWEPSLSGFTAGFNAPVPAVTDNLPLVASTTGDAQNNAIQRVCEAIDRDSAQIPLLSRPTLIAWRDDRIDAEFLQRDNDTNPLRNLATFTER